MAGITGTATRARAPLQVYDRHGFPIQGPLAPQARQIALAVTTTTASIYVGSYYAVELTTTAACFFTVGGAGITAVAATTSVAGDAYLPANTPRIYRLDPDAPYIAAIMASGTATLYITPLG